MKTKVEAIKNILDTFGVVGVDSMYLEENLKLNCFNPNVGASYNAWIGDNVLNIAMERLYKRKNGSRCSTRELKKYKDSYCCEIHQVDLLDRIGIGDIVLHLSEHNKADFFESLINYIYEKDSLEGVTNFLEEIDFLTISDNKDVVRFNINSELLEYTKLKNQCR